MLRRLADGRQADSLSARFRRRRFAFFQSLLDTLPRPLHILDIGGTRHFWKTMPFQAENTIQITLLNLNPVRIPPDQPYLTSIAGDARAMPQYADQSFDLVFSNSVIEHVGSLEDQQRMAAEVQRIGQRYFVQTPNYYFPIEPHFLFPGFQFLPVDLRLRLIMRFNLGWHKRMSDENAARELIAHTRLMKKRELLALFPKAQLYEEKLFGVTKSLTVYRGF